MSWVKVSFLITLCIILPIKGPGSPPPHPSNWPQTHTRCKHRFFLLSLEFVGRGQCSVVLTVEAFMKISCPYKSFKYRREREKEAARSRRRNRTHTHTCAHAHMHTHTSTHIFHWRVEAVGSRTHTYTHTHTWTHASTHTQHTLLMFQSNNFYVLVHHSCSCVEHESFNIKL